MPCPGSTRAGSTGWMSDHTHPTDESYGPDRLSVGSPDDGGTWLTKAELARVRRISVASADRLIRRQGWRRQPGNDGRVRVLVPSDWIKPGAGNPTDRESQNPTDILQNPTDNVPDPTDIARYIVAFEAALTVLREAHASEIATLHGVIDGLRSSIARGEDRAARTEADRNAERTRADALRDRLNGMQEQLAEAHAALQAAAAADARAERAEADRVEERGRADRAETATTAERARADALRERIEVLQVQITARQEVIDAAEATRRADDARKARGRWGRLRAAWRGE
jgi:hypothetical protein